MKDLTIRYACREDAERIACVHIRSRRAAMPWLPVIHSYQETLHYFSGQVLINDDVRVAKIDDRVIGFIALQGRHMEHLCIFCHPTKVGASDLVCSVSQNN